MGSAQSCAREDGLSRVKTGSSKSDFVLENKKQLLKRLKDLNECLQIQTYLNNNGSNKMKSEQEDEEEEEEENENMFRRNFEKRIRTFEDIDICKYELTDEEISTSYVVSNNKAKTEISFLSVLSQFTNLSRLNLSYNCLSIQGLELLLTTLSEKEGNFLTSLNLSGNDFSSLPSHKDQSTQKSAGQIVSLFLKHENNEHLQELILYQCQLSDRDLKQILFSLLPSVAHPQLTEEEEELEENEEKESTNLKDFNNTLDVLDIDYNFLSNDLLYTFVETLRSVCPSSEEQQEEEEERNTPSQDDNEENKVHVAIIWLEESVRCVPNSVLNGSYSYDVAPNTTTTVNGLDVDGSNGFRNTEPPDDNVRVCYGCTPDGYFANGENYYYSTSADGPVNPLDASCEGEEANEEMEDNDGKENDVDRDEVDTTSSKFTTSTNKTLFSSTFYGKDKKYLNSNVNFNKEETMQKRFALRKKILRHELTGNRILSPFLIEALQTLLYANKKRYEMKRKEAAIVERAQKELLKEEEDRIAMRQRLMNSSQGAKTNSRNNKTEENAFLMSIPFTKRKYYTTLNATNKNNTDRLIFDAEEEEETNGTNTQNYANTDDNNNNASNRSNSGSGPRLTNRNSLQERVYQRRQIQRENGKVLLQKMRTQTVPRYYNAQKEKVLRNGFDEIKVTFDYTSSKTVRENVLEEQLRKERQQLQPCWCSPTTGIVPFADKLHYHCVHERPPHANDLPSYLKQKPQRNGSKSNSSGQGKRGGKDKSSNNDNNENTTTTKNNNDNDPYYGCGRTGHRCRSNLQLIQAGEHTKRYGTKELQSPPRDSNRKNKNQDYSYSTTKLNSGKNSKTIQNSNDAKRGAQKYYPSKGAESFFSSSFPTVAAGLITQEYSF